ncbi:MAG: fumarylacetoacetate hydrolase family protein [Bacillota bacterium]
MSNVKEYIRFRCEGQTHYGLVQGDKVSFLEGDLFANPVVTDHQAKLDQVQLLAPCLPGKAVCVGLNYRRHAEELGMKLPDEPIIFLKPSDAVIGPNDAIIYWPSIGQLDYESELAIVIGKAGRDIPEQDAMDYVFGYTIANDVTARDLQRKDGQWTRAKGFDTFLPVGPRIVAGIDASDLHLQAILNGQVKQDSRTSDMIFSIPQMISFVSTVMTLYPGDLILTGTPSGIGPMRVGDTIECVIEGLGRLVNTIGRP